MRYVNSQRLGVSADNRGGPVPQELESLLITIHELGREDGEAQVFQGGEPGLLWVTVHGGELAPRFAAGDMQPDTAYQEGLRIVIAHFQQPRIIAVHEKVRGSCGLGELREDGKLRISLHEVASIFGDVLIEQRRIMVGNGDPEGRILLGVSPHGPVKGIAVASFEAITQT